MDRMIPSEVVEEWMVHLRRERTRARELVWLIEGGATIHDGRNGTPTADATKRWLAEQRAVIADVDRLEELYESLNAPAAQPRPRNALAR
jgi:hypothetical protein